MLIFVTVIGRSAMRILVLGAGGIGGYFGARIHAAGGDVTFLVRPARAAQMRENGLKVTSPSGDFLIPSTAALLTVPAGAVQLRLSVDDCFFSDNKPVTSDPLRLVIKKAS